MSARIPDTALLSDLLKPTGYDCPERLQGKTFDEATLGGGDISIEANKEVTISENGTTVINPSEGNDVMKKVTVDVNVPILSGDLRYFDGRNSGISSAPKCFFVIGKHQTTGKTSVMVLAAGATAYCVPQEVIEVTSTTLEVGGAYNKTFSEVTADVVSAALATLK